MTASAPASAFFEFAPAGQRLSAHAGSATLQLMQRIDAPLSHLSASVNDPWRSTPGPSRPTDLGTELFDTRATMKIAVSRVSMHLDHAWRKAIFSHLDRLLSVESWAKGDELPRRASMSTMLRAIIFERTLRPPSLGVSNAGNFLAAWIRDRDRLTVEFLLGDEIRWMLVHYPDGKRESLAGQGSSTRFRTVISPSSFTWIFDGGSPTHR